jgi:hypothetical protein
VIPLQDVAVGDVAVRLDPTALPHQVLTVNQQVLGERPQRAAVGQDVALVEVVAHRRAVDAAEVADDSRGIHVANPRAEAVERVVNLRLHLIGRDEEVARCRADCRCTRDGDGATGHIHGVGRASRAQRRVVVGGVNQVHIHALVHEGQAVDRDDRIVIRRREDGQFTHAGEAAHLGVQHAEDAPLDAVVHEVQGGGKGVLPLAA